ncbi:hypothetical protein [Mycoplasma putrefaciens]|uniref:Uncharacterized protein n=1 Tax=Mycoplasma putrefaciens (strain ATCC 15718 / NCTC 10155 / C30 KS-1 / KS-1) TaxID=743965 RepID=A0A7U4E9U2_MYCPK|nr:hypothetical protein [Mycoplasma putrefaciens]AEM69010.1 uncharacterized protein MPUT_0673 [Mycoplasma putrefaciens KS1]
MSKRLTKKKVALFLKREKYFKEFVNQNDLVYSDFKQSFANKRVGLLVKSYLNILGISDITINTENHWEVLNFINLSSYYFYYHYTKKLSSKKLTQILNTIRLTAKKHSFTKLESNYEKELLKILKRDYQITFTEKQIQKYFNYHEIYNYVANAFCRAFQKEKKQQIYDYAYWYILHAYTRKYLREKQQNNIWYKLFFLELISSQKFIQAISDFSPELFNILIIRNNKILSSRESQRKVEDWWKNH